MTRKTFVENNPSDNWVKDKMLDEADSHVVTDRTGTDMIDVKLDDDYLEDLKKHMENSPEWSKDMLMGRWDETHGLLNRYKK